MPVTAGFETRLYVRTNKLLEYKWKIYWNRKGRLELLNYCRIYVAQKQWNASNAVFDHCHVLLEHNVPAKLSRLSTIWVFLRMSGFSGCSQDLKLTKVFNDLHRIKLVSEILSTLEQCDDVLLPVTASMVMWAGSRCGTGSLVVCDRSS